MQALAQFDFTATSPQEVSFRAHQILTIAPQDVQGELWNSGWLMGSVDQKTSGLVPVNYFKIIRNPNSAPIPISNHNLGSDNTNSNIGMNAVDETALKTEPVAEKSIGESQATE